MAEADRDRNRDLPAPLSSDDWISLLDMFWELTHFLGDPEEAPPEIRRALLRGQVRSLCRQFLDSGVKDTELTRAFWRDIKLFAGQDQGRDTIGLRLTKDTDPSTISGAIFYLHRADCLKVWPDILLPIPAAPLSEIAAPTTAQTLKSLLPKAIDKNPFPADRPHRWKTQWSEKVAAWINARHPNTTTAKSVRSRMYDLKLWPSAQ
jgi:hypothetical protein